MTLHNEHLPTAISCRLNLAANRKTTAPINDEGATVFILEATNNKRSTKPESSWLQW
jgi:hypothetical protein